MSSMMINPSIAMAQQRSSKQFYSTPPMFIVSIGQLVPLRHYLRKIYHSGYHPASQWTMSGFEVFGLITGIIGLIETLGTVYKSVKDLNGLPETFQEVVHRIPLLEQTLQAARAHTNDVESDKEAEALCTVLKNCEKKTKQLLEILEEINKNKDKSARAIYQRLVLQLGKASRVETLLDNILKDLQVLAAHRAFKAALETQAEALDEGRKKLEQVAREKPSVPDSMFEEPSGTTNINYGRDQITNTVRGTQNNVKGHQFNANGNQSFGRIPEAPTQEPSESPKSSEVLIIMVNFQDAIAHTPRAGTVGDMWSTVAVVLKLVANIRALRTKSMVVDGGVRRHGRRAFTSATVQAEDLDNWLGDYYEHLKAKEGRENKTRKGEFHAAYLTS
ncbi:hypothetical protein VFPPC_10585 [Pochonia chlamydosporia 170]|uniref:NACHT-NTPase and P-loop NTPases N-terminal domain-containing protein n=1 Tax=Pochonia chlamydosporia 170 TaxID=1380566 RepID=A0A179F4W5_METCM|nr:hypothetical protein VFPPC_10585 [Pochonia chlamydosporia 170]OAQ60149.1 hypothetical protein VFPPC_10585 [Pochonia chlamydosporia 170]